MRTKLPRCRHMSTRLFAFLLFFLGLVAYCYYYTTPNRKPGHSSFNALEEKTKVPSHHIVKKQRPLPDHCPLVMKTYADIDTTSVYQQFEFQPSWLRTKEFWDKTFEDRYEKIKTEKQRPKLKVFVVPHSHNDPGWLNTFEQYFEWRSKKIINNMVQKLSQYQNMTFIWTEISFLNSWWETSHPVKRKVLKKLVSEGRLEITTGGWVMPDEACTHIYALIDQFIEGHHWVKTNLGVSPKTGWSIDPFGHGPTVPYLLNKSGLEGAIIQRIHYAWKQWLAQRQIEEFFWIPGWKTSGKTSLIVHNQPFDIYSIKSSCGPHPAVCLSFDFRRIPGEYSEYTDKFEEITDQNVERKSKTLIEEYDRIGSLTKHNVVLVPLGDDFRYEYPSEFDSQYVNYMKMFNFINGHQEMFNADVSFGTPIDYFNAVKERLERIPTLKGDFFVYSDIFTEGKPAYWSGYFTTRPYLKLLARQFEHQLRTAEILFTLAYNHLKQKKNPRLEASERLLEKYYEQLIAARRNLGLFQHHDAITGTSRASVMYDYGLKLFNHIYYCICLQEAALMALMIPDEKVHLKNALQSEVVWDTYGKPAKKLQVSFADKKKVILFNPLVEFRKEVVTLRSNTSNVRVYDTRLQLHVPYQIAPNIEVREDGRRVISDLNFDLLFEASMPPLTSVTFNLEEHVNASNHCIVFCNNCSNLEQGQNVFLTKRMLPGDIQLENSYMKLVINRNTGFLRQVYRKDLRKRNAVEIQFGAYQSAQRHSGAYLFMPDYEAPEKPVLNSYSNGKSMQDDNIIIVSGPVSTELTVLYLPFLVHTLRIFNVDDPYLARGIFIENVVDFESPPKNRDTELFMRIQTDLQNGEPPEFFTDQNGFQYQKRTKVEKLGIAANYYPITTMAWLQDEETRVSLITNHAQGASAFEPGRLEIMLDRRTLYDDFRGIGEGVLDNKPMTFQNWLTIEAMPGAPRYRRDTDFERVHQDIPEPDSKDNLYELPTQTAEFLSRTLNYPVNVYLIDTSEVGDIDVKTHETFINEFPDGVHLMTLRSIPDPSLDQVPSHAAYMVLHRPGYSCSVGADKAKRKTFSFTRNTNFTHCNLTNLTSVSLTGLKTYGKLNSFYDIRMEPMEVKTYQIRF